MNLNEKLDTFIYLADQHGILIAATSITEESFRFKPRIIGKASEGLDDARLLAKCKDLAVSVGLDCVGDKCFLKKPKLETKQDK